MIRSMTGFGRYSETLAGRLITAELRSVNHRYFEYASRIPRSYSFLDEKVKSEVSTAVSRGKIDVNIYIQSVSANDVVVKVDKGLAGNYLKAFSELCDELGVPNDVKATTFSRLPDIFTTERIVCDEGELSDDVLKVLKPALLELCAMREREGEKLYSDILTRLGMIEEHAKKIEEGNGDRQKEYHDRLFSKLQLLLSDNNIDQSRLVTEAAIFADKTSVSEETVRIASHIKQFIEIMKGDEPAGRKLDFLIQELNREVNTIGSKISDSEVTMTVIEMKSQLEKIREQIQNVE